MGVEKEQERVVEMGITPNPGELLIGEIAGIAADGRTLVAWDGPTRAQPRPALSTQPVSQADRGRRVALAFAANNGGEPVILGFIQSALDQVVALTDVDMETGTAETPVVRHTEHGVEIHAEQSLTLVCGKSRVTLTRDGRVLVRAENIVSRASGSHQIKGGSVHLN